MKDILNQLKTISVRKPLMGFHPKYSGDRAFSNIQVNFGIKKGKISVKLGFIGCSFTGNSGLNLHAAIFNTLRQARDLGYTVTSTKPTDYLP